VEAPEVERTSVDVVLPSSVPRGEASGVGGVEASLSVLRVDDFAWHREEG
jgi:hypothetical protein